MKNTLPTLLILILFACSQVSEEKGSQSDLPFLISGNGHYFETKEGEPFFWLADTNWRLFAGAKRADIPKYFSVRQQQGFNVIQVFYTMNWAQVNANGDSAFVNKNPLKLDANYLNEALYTIEEAQKHKLNIFMVIGQPLKFDTYLHRIDDEELAYQYGFTMGTAFKACKNIIWGLGQDFEGVRNSLWHAVAEGVHDAYDGISNFDGEANWDNALMSYHIGWESSTSVTFHNEPWLDFNMIQTSHMRQDNHSSYFWPWIDWNKSLAKPVLDGEPNYEYHPVWKENGRIQFTPYDIRKASYRSVFAGGCGISFGNNHIWPLKDDWMEHLYSPGAEQLKHLKNLILSYPYFERVPDKHIVHSVNPNDANKIIGTRSKTGQYALIYVPESGQSFQLNLKTLQGEDLSFKWYCTQTGQFTKYEVLSDIDKDSTDSNRVFAFTSPIMDGTKDWVLVITTDKKMH